MTATLTVPTAPPLSTMPNVELCQTGTWALSTGPATFTTDDFIAAVAALDCPSVRRPVLKLQHDYDEKFGQGDPAIGYVANMRGEQDWRTLVGDFAGMPGWLATPDENGMTVLASAFPDRSVEAAWDWTCQLGHTHPFVVLAITLLGSKLPGVGTLASLQDVAELYGVNGAPELVTASAQQAAAAAVTVVIPATADRKEPAMPNPAARVVAATVTSDDVRRAFYDSPVGSSWDVWIEEIQLDPLQVIYVDDAEGTRYRLPITIDSAGDGTDAVTFGTAVKVVLRYDDAPANTAAASAGAHEPIRFATRAESRPGQRPAAAAPPTPAPPENPTEGSPAVAFTDEQLTTMRQRLGLPDDADETAILAAMNEALEERADPPVAPVAPTLPEGVVAIDSTQLDELRTAAAAGQDARSEQLRTQREQLVAAAVQAGRIPPARREHWLTALETDFDGNSKALAALEPGLIPVELRGHSLDTTSDDALYNRLFPQPAGKDN